MAPSPPKPWETQSTTALSLPSTAVSPPVDGVVPTTSTSAPPLPLRSYDSSDPVLNAANPSSMYHSRFGNTYGGVGTYGGLSPYSSPYSRFGGMGSSMYGGYGSSMYGGSMYGGMGYGGYPGYSGMGGFGGYGGMGDPNDPNSLSRRMEAGTQATFQIIESIVGAFGGFAQMLESTFMATHSSFFAMVSVAEQFGNLRDTLGSIFGIYTLMRYVRVAIAKLRGRPLPPEDSEISTDSFSTFSDPNTPQAPRASKKPLVIFLLVLFGLPYLMGKLIRAMASAQSQQLISRPIDPSTAEFSRAQFDYIPRNPASEIPLKKGDVVAIIHRTDAGWWRARLRDGREGYVPANYLEPVHNPVRSRPPIVSPPGEKGHAFIEEFKDE